ncbi:hypothetical protein BGZ60DRAFT_448441 [Tricladium varicosporioides]|nr:hypothetical protein BGZ60DRAFT_448441 [Hymenoscyphus varicosporioides]
MIPKNILHKLCDVISSMEIQVFLETSGPNFLQEEDTLSCVSISGIVVRNGLILENGERRDCFSLATMRTTIKSFVLQSSTRDFTVLFWETWDDGALPSNAVLQRTMKWCNFYNAILWRGPQRALCDAAPIHIPVQPLSAFDWLKDPQIMQLHDLWKSRQVEQFTGRQDSNISNIMDLLRIPEMGREATASRCHHNVSPASESLTTIVKHPDWYNIEDLELGDPFSLSQTGNTLNGLGCFPFGVEVEAEDFHNVVMSQKRLRDLGLLDTVPASKLREYGQTLMQFISESDLQKSSAKLGAACEPNYAEKLAEALRTAPDNGSGKVRLYIGLNSGFQQAVNKQFWAVYSKTQTNGTDIYLSKNVDEVLTTILHAFLSSCGLTRQQCLVAEILFARWLNPLDKLPRRFQQEIKCLTPEEGILLLQRMSLAPEAHIDEMHEHIRSALMTGLIDLPSFNQLKSLNTVGFISEDVDVEELVTSRILWHCQYQREHPEPATAMALFLDIQSLVLNALKCRDRPTIETLTTNLGQFLHHDVISVVEDIFAMSVFCTMRKASFEELYIEVTDRNPLFNDQPDQAAAFAELFGLGARCESYFDMSPSQVGKLLSAKFRRHYRLPEHAPPVFEENQGTLNSAYAEAQTDVSQNDKQTRMPSYIRYTFLSVFAIPALIDVLMLTTTGHGIYLSAKMTYTEQHSATIALMLSLLLSGAIGTWITCGGTYYLASMAFSAMNYFVLTRLLGGLAFTLVVGLVGLLILTFQVGFYSGVVFFLYLIGLTTYLCLLAALANYQTANSAYQSGRRAILLCIPILFLSPVVTIFVPYHDMTVYLTVLYIFVIMLLLSVRVIGARWTTWYQNITLIDDTSLRKWYTDRLPVDEQKELTNITDLAVLRLAREALLQEVIAEMKAHIFHKRNPDSVVVTLAECYGGTNFLMDWYCQSSGVSKPIVFSSAWNIQTKVALKSLQRSQLGIRFHNGFIHWRQAGDEIGCSMLYFVVAILDKWVSLLVGGQTLGFGTMNVSLRFAVGFGLAYYLIGAVLLDFNTNKLHKLVEKTNYKVNISNESDIPNAVEIESENRKRVYWKALFHYLAWHVWGLATTTMLFWLFATQEGETYLFLSYVLAYTGLLWYQFTKIFCGPHALKPLLIGIAVGLPLGLILHYQMPNFLYSEVIALAAATWTVAILSMWAAKIFGKPKTYSIPEIFNLYHVYSWPGQEQFWSKSELQELYRQVSGLPEKERHYVDPSSAPGHHLLRILTTYGDTKLIDLAERAFPTTEPLLALSCRLFREGSIRVEITPIEIFTAYDNAIRAISSTGANNVLRIYVGQSPLDISSGQSLPPSAYKGLAQLVIQVTAERHLGFSPRDAFLVSNLWSSNEIQSGSPNSSLVDQPKLNCGLNNFGGSFSADELRTQLTRDLLLRIDPALDWEALPSDFRHYLIKRCLGDPTPMTDKQTKFITKKLKLHSSEELENYISRCNYSAFVGASSLAQKRSCDDFGWKLSDSIQIEESPTPLPPLPRNRPYKDNLQHQKCSVYDKLLAYFGFFYHSLGTFCKFFSIAFVADPEYQRELQCTFPSGFNVWNTIARGILLSVWLWSKVVQQILLPMFLLYKRDGVVTVWKNIQGMEISVKRQRVSIRNFDGIHTGFLHPMNTDTIQLFQYKGKHKSEPPQPTQLVAINTYSPKLQLQRRVEMLEGKVVNDFVYEYGLSDPSLPRRLSRSDMLPVPITRKATAGQNSSELVKYNSKGQIDSGSYLRDGNLVRFQYHYQRGSKYFSTLLRAEFVLPHLSCTVSWCARPRRRIEKLDTWIPRSQVTEVTFVVGTNVWESKYIYDHKYHPTIITMLNGERVDTPPLILYDHLDILNKPVKHSFLDDNPLFSFTTTEFNPVSHFLGSYTKTYHVSTSQSRSWLWKAWADDPTFDGILARWLDERLLRRDPILRPYWRKRDMGFLTGAEQYLDQNRDAVIASIDLDSSISSLTPLAIKINDLYTFGQGGDACSSTRSNLTTEKGNEPSLHVIAMDTGTWPNEAGGVSACRSDVINNLQTVKWHMVAESANDFGIPKRQIEKNIHSLKIIPLWGLDLLTPTHGLFTNRLDSEVKHITTYTTMIDIKQQFIPILEAIVTVARALDFSMSDMKQATRALVNLNTYFQTSAAWSETWSCDIVKAAWRHLWLSQTTPNTRPSSQWLRSDLPTLGQLDQALEIWSRYLFIFAIPIPDRMPAVFQASHHSVSASYGVVCKIKRGCTLQIWDHAISWRETNLYLSSALCPLSPFVRNSLLGLMRMTSIITLHHADTILPCADFFNPNWEIEIGTCQGRVEHRFAFRRKIDPVVNGITRIERFSPAIEIKASLPTVVMLSHVWYAKDIKTALLAADIIINIWGFQDYRLEIYGSLDKTTSYTTHCQEIIATKGLRHQVSLRGEADPHDVLERAWVFLNSSISEGLPLALGEAALTGAPVVCTDVGASLRVLTDAVDGSCFSAIVAPNDALAMARAQIKILALLDEFATYSDPSLSTEETQDYSFPATLTQQDIERIAKRMYEQAPARRKLGMRTREIVQKSFCGDRYLREHEQMLWVGKSKHDMARSFQRLSVASTPSS